MRTHPHRIDFAATFVIDPTLDESFTEHIVGKKEVVVTLEALTIHSDENGVDSEPNTRIGITSFG